MCGCDGFCISAIGEGARKLDQGRSSVVVWLDITGGVIDWQVSW